MGEKKAKEFSGCAPADTVFEKDVPFKLREILVLLVALSWFFIVNEPTPFDPKSIPVEPKLSIAVSVAP